MSRSRLLSVLSAGLLVAGCTGQASPSPNASAEASASEAPPSQATASASASSSGVLVGVERDASSASVVFDAASMAVDLLPSTGQPAPIGPVIQPNRSVIGGGPTDAGAQTVQDIGALAYADVDAFWAANWETGYPTIFYEPVSSLTFYNSAEGIRPESSCVKETDDANIWAINAFYCFGDQGMAYDVVLADKELSETGDFAIVGTVAHEWGHHLQNLILGQQGSADVPVFSVEAELQADCFAGMYTAGAGEAGTFPVSVDDVQEAADGFYASGTAVGAGWFEPQFHGTPEQRYEAWAYGYEATDVRACDAYATWGDALTLADGPYEIGYLPDSTVESLPTGAYAVSGSGYGSATLVVDGLTVAADTFDASLVEAMRAYAPNADGTDTAITLVGELTDYSETTTGWGIPGVTLGFSYTYAGPDEPRHGHMIINLSPAEDVLVLDARIPGEGTPETYLEAGAAATIAIKSFQTPGLL